ncbi:MAG: GntR family transcriptional regulator [Atribacterota bacterium]|jgi:GntR family transcriptional regulator of arabinose operon|nr:GntR family transcriptional regulator [Atribacterota bacterium]MDD5637067.1 GntR family transcriptional regulator [Atribacterota bacterium]
MEKNDQFIPKYYQLKEYLKDMIQSGGVLPKQKLPSESELIRQFKISRHTVRHAFSELENEGLIYKEQGKGTFCAYRGSKKERRIAVLTTYISNYIFPYIIRGIEEILCESGFSFSIASTGNDKQREEECMKRLLEQDISGLIVEPTKSARPNLNLKYFQELERRGVPYIFLHATYPDLDSAYIIMDDEKGGYLATKYLLELGHRNIAGIFLSDDLQGVRRQTGFLSALKEYSISINNEYLGNYNTEQLFSYPFHFSMDLLRKKNCPTAIVCYNDQITIQVIEAIRRSNLKIPVDISVVGYDNSNLAIATEVKLTTINHPKDEMGKRVARMIVDMIEGKEDKPAFIYQPELIIRSSCASVSQELSRTK